MSLRLCLAAGLILGPSLAFAAGGCRSIEPELIVTADVLASMAVIERPETCSLVVSIVDTSSEMPTAFGISLAGSAVHGEARIAFGLLQYRRTVDTAEIETLPVRLTSGDGQSHGATLIIRMPAPAAGS